MESVSSWSETSECLTFHLIGSLPSKKRPRQLRLRMRPLKSGWEPFDSESFPAVNLYPSSFYLLADQPPRQPWKAEVLAVALDCKSQLYPSRYSIFSDRLSYTWRGCWSDSVLGKRDGVGSPLTEKRLSHHLSVSRLGIERALPNSHHLDQYLNDRLARLPSIRRALQQRDFEVRFDDTTANFDLWVWAGDTPQRVKTFVCKGNGCQQLPSIDPFQIVPQLVQSILRSNHLCPTNNLIQQYSHVVTFLNNWIATHEDCSTTTLLPDLDHRLRPIEYIIRWSEAFFRFFFCPLVKVSCPTALLGVPLREVFGVPVGLTRVHAFILIENALKYFEQIQNLNAQLELAKRSGQISALFKSCVEAQETYQQSLLKDFPDLFSLTQNLLNSERHFQAWKALVQKETREGCRLSAVRRLSRRTVSQLRLSEIEVQVLMGLTFGLACRLGRKEAQTDFVSKINFGWLTIQNIAGVHRFCNTNHAGDFQRSSRIKLVTSHCEILVFFMETVKPQKDQEICVIHDNDLIKSYGYPPSWSLLESCVSSFVTEPPIWSKGTLFKMGRRLSNQLYMFVIDFRPCRAKPVKPPTFLCKYVEGFELNPDKYDLEWGNIWAYACGSICFMSYSALSLPTVWISSVTHEQIHEPTELDWCSSLPQSKIQKLAKFGSRSNIKSCFHLAVTEQPPRIYLCILDTRTNLTFEKEKNFDLTVLVSNLSTKLPAPQVFTYKQFHLSEYFAKIISPLKEINSSVIRVTNYEFLMLNFGELKNILIGVVGCRLQWLPVNHQLYFSIPEALGTEMSFYGVQSNYFMQHYYSTKTIKFQKNLRLSYEYMEFSY